MCKVIFSYFRKIQNDAHVIPRRLENRSSIVSLMALCASSRHGHSAHSHECIESARSLCTRNGEGGRCIESARSLCIPLLSCHLCVHRGGTATLRARATQVTWASTWLGHSARVTSQGIELTRSLYPDDFRMGASTWHGHSAPHEACGSTWLGHSPRAVEHGGVSKRP